MTTQKRLRLLVVSMVVILALGTAGYMTIMGWGFIDSLYMTIITLSTVGLGEVGKLNAEGEIFTIFLVVFGVSTAAYLAGTIGQFVLEGQLKDIWGRRKMEKAIRSFKDHYVVCGFGRVGRQVCKEFAARQVKFVVVEKDPEVAKELAETGYRFIFGDSSEDQTLIDAGVERAKGLVTVLASEADNVYVTLSARQLNPKIFITARASSPSAEKKLYRAGADRVVSPHVMGGNRMAIGTLSPHVGEFLMLGCTGEESGLSIEEFHIRDGSVLAGKSIKDSLLRDRYGFTVVAMKKPGRKLIVNPKPDTLIEVGDVLIIIGEAAKLDLVESA